MIKLENIDYAINNHKILKNINLELKEGKVTVIFGPSGAGKSTLLSIVDLLTVPDNGYITIDQKKYDLTKVSKKDTLEYHTKVSMVFQNYPLFLNKNVLENLVEPLRIVQKLSKQEAKEIALEKLEKLHLSDKLDAMPYQLSGGQKQRVNIARVLSLNTKIVLLDEPTSALDHNLVSEIKQNIQLLKSKNITVIVVTHDLEFGNDIADDTVYIRDGEIINQASIVEQYRFAGI